MVMKIYITGIRGLIGSHLAKHLVEKGYTVGGCDDESGGVYNEVPCEVAEYDCVNNHLLTSETVGYDMIIHCAALPYEGLSIVSPHLITNNITSTANSVMYAAIKNKLDVVFMSSMARYGFNKVPFTEDMVPQPVDPYGIAKLYSENLVKNLCDVYKLNWLIIVPHNVIGVGQRYDDPYRNVVSIFINQMLQGKSPIIYGDGNQTRRFSPVSDFVFFVTELIESGISDEVINVGSDIEMSINDLFNMLKKKLKFRKKPVYVKDRVNEVDHAWCSHQKMENFLCLISDTGLSTCIDRMIDDIKKKGTKPFNYNLPIEFTEYAPDTWKRALQGSRGR